MEWPSIVNYGNYNSMFCIGFDLFNRALLLRTLLGTSKIGWLGKLRELQAILEI
jgi:hypothetical protein